MQNYYIHRCSFCSRNIHVMVYFITSVSQISIKPWNLACLPPSTQLWLHLSQCGIPGVQHVWGPCAGETRRCIHTIHIMISSKLGIQCFIARNINLWWTFGESVTTYKMQIFRVVNWGFLQGLKIPLPVPLCMQWTNVHFTCTRTLE